jgi:hypothetical protein
MRVRNGAFWRDEHDHCSDAGGRFAVCSRAAMGAYPELPGPGGAPAPFDPALVAPYALRHSYAQRHADAGVPVDVPNSWHGATPPRTGSSVGEKPQVASSANPRTMPTKRTATAKDGSVTCEHEGGGSPAPNTTARLPSFGPLRRQAAQLRPAWSSNRTIRSGSPIRLSGFSGIMRATSDPELPTNVYRVDGKTGAAAVVAGD